MAKKNKMAEATDAVRCAIIKFDASEKTPDDYAKVLDAMHAYYAAGGFFEVDAMLSGVSWPNKENLGEDW